MVFTLRTVGIAGRQTARGVVVASDHQFDGRIHRDVELGQRVVVQPGEGLVGLLVSSFQDRLLGGLVPP